MEKKQFFDFEKEEKEVLLKFYTDTEAQLLTELARVQAKIRELGGTPLFKADGPNKLQVFTDNNIITPAVEVLEPYADDWTLPKKIKFVLVLAGKYMTARAIFDKIAEYEPYMKESKKIEYGYQAQIASTISHKTDKKKDFMRYRDNDESEYQVGLIEWFTANGHPKEQYM